MKINKILFFNIATLVPPLVVIGLYGYIGTYNRLLGDSLCSYYYAKRLGLFRSIWYWRITWSGRYSAYGFDWLLSKIFPPQLIPWFIPIIIFAWILISSLSIYFFLKSNNPEGADKALAVTLGVILVFFFLTTTPTIEQSFFWIDGFRAYTLPLIILSGYGLLYQRFNHIIKTRFHHFLTAIISFNCFLFSGGFSETFSAVQIVVIIFLILFYWLTENPFFTNKEFLFFFSGLLGGIAAMIIVITAPGNAIRQSFFPTPPSFIKLLEISLDGYQVFLSNLISLKSLVAIVGSIIFSIWAGSIYSGNFRMHGRKILLLITGAFIVSFSCFPPGVYGYSEPPPDRVLSIAVFFAGVMLMSAGFIAGSFTRENFSNNKKMKDVIFIISLILLTAASWMNFNTSYATRDKYIEYAMAWDKTDTIIKEAKQDGKKSVSVIPNASWAELDSLNDNPKHWVNECYSSFYGIQVFGIQ